MEYVVILKVLKDGVIRHEVHTLSTMKRAESLVKKANKRKDVISVGAIMEGRRK